MKSGNVARDAATPDDQDAEVTLAEELEQKIAHVERIARLRLLWESRSFLGRILVGGLAVAIAIAFLIPKRYESTARLMPPDEQSGSGVALLASLAARAGSGELGSLAGNLLGVRTTGDLFIGILTSRTMRDRLVDQFNLRNVYRVSDDSDARKKLGENTKISSDRLSGIITLTVVDHDPRRAAAMDRAYIDGLNNMVTDLSTSAAHRERVFLEGRLASVRENLEQAEKQFSQFASKNSAIDIPEQGKAMLTAAATLQGQLIAAESELEALRQLYTDGNVRVREANARVQELRAQLQKIGGAESDSKADDGSTGQSLYPSIRKLPLLGVTYADLYRNAKVQEVVFEALTQEYELAKVEEAKEIPSVKVLDSPNVPEKKSFPPRTIIIVAGALLSLALGVVWVLGSAKWASVDAQDPAKVLADEILSTMKTRLHFVTRNGSRPEVKDAPQSPEKAVDTRSKSQKV